MKERTVRAGLLAAVGAAGAAGWRAHRAAIKRLRTAIREERRWSRRLAERLHDVQTAGRPLSGGDDVRDLVLRTAMGLLGAPKGVLLSRADADADGDFDMVCVRGFDNDPEHLPVVQRFTREVLKRDEMVREDTVTSDDEIDCLVAVPVYLFDQFHGVVICANRPGGFGKVDDDVLLALGDHAGAALHSHRLDREMRDAHRGAVRMLSELLASCEPRLAADAADAATLAAALARRMGIDGPERDALVCAAALRDVGLLTVPREVLAKAGPLSAEERAVVERHPQVGFEVIGQVSDLRDVSFGVLYHHERHDGRGYPAGLAGDGIPRGARIVAAVDAYCAMTHERPYRPARSQEEAVQELLAHAGTQFDPEVVTLLVEELERPRLRSVDAGTAEAIMEWLMLPDRPPVAGGPAGERLAAGIDGLTQLGSHRAFHEAAAAAADGPFAVLVLELVELGAINEREGYAEGDRVLSGASRKLARAAARAGLAAFRDGGPRFGIVAPGYESDAARALLDDVNAEFAVGPPVRLAVATRLPGQDGDTVIAAAYRALDPLRPHPIGGSVQT